MTQVGIDVGGTFTDAVLVDTDSGRVRTHKTSTTDDIATGVRDGFVEICEDSGVDPEAVERFTHGSTVAVNALIEDTGAKTALLTTAGFADILEIGEGNRDASLLYNPCNDHEAPLVPRRHRFGVEERIGVDGDVTTPLSLDDLDRAVDSMVADDVEAVAICFLHSHKNPVHERRAAERIRELTTDLVVSVSADVSPVVREYPRTATTAVDAYVKPVVSSYLSRLGDTLEAEGLPTPYTVMKSDGGVASSDLVSDRPVTQVVSGPVAGVESARYLGRAIGMEDLITLDMGGTSVDTAMIENGKPMETATRSVRGMPVNGPFVDVETKGAGGGAIAWLDEVDALQVGPRSAGANPGPICYGRGGTEPTVTDADLVLGLLNPDRFAGGGFDLDAATARDGIEDRIADPLGIDVRAAAVSIREVVDAHLANAVRASSVERGLDPRDFSLMAFGGAGPMHACSVARDMGIDTVVIPNHAGLVSSLGVLLADVTHDYSRSLIETVEDATVDQLRSVGGDLAERAVADLEAEDVDPADRRFTLAFDTRYTGQSHNLTIPLVSDARSVEDLLDAITEAAIDRLGEVFAERHRERYGFVDETNTVGLINARVTARGVVGSPHLGIDAPETSLADARRGEREVVLDRESTVTTPYYDWNAVPAECAVSGPAVFHMDNSTIWLPPGFEADIDDQKHVVATDTGAGR
jgi:N-methylhydantoinase A